MFSAVAGMSTVTEQMGRLFHTRGAATGKAQLLTDKWCLAPT